MVNQDIVAYIQSSGRPLDKDLYEHLIKEGHNEHDVLEAIAYLTKKGKSIGTPEKKNFWEKIPPIWTAFGLIGLSVLVMLTIFSLMEPAPPERSFPAPPSVAERYCSKNETCFYLHAQTCTPAKLLIERTEGQGSTSVETRALNTLKGFEGEECILTSRYLTFAVTEEGEFVDYGITGKEMVCRLPKSALPDLRAFLESDQLKAVCTGPLRDALDELFR